MKGTVRREPGLQLPDLPYDVTEIVARGTHTFTLHSRKPWTDVMDELGRRMFPDGPHIGGPAVPDKAPVVSPRRRAKKATAAMPYKDLD